MKTYNKLYTKLCSKENILLAFNKAKKGKSKKDYVIDFQLNLEYNLNELRDELINKRYLPSPLKKFIIRDPKTRIIHSSIFRDRIIHHAIVNLLEPIFEKIFIYDSFASRKNKGTHSAVKRFRQFINKVSNNGSLIKNPYSNNSIKGFVLKADIKHYFDSIDHKVLINIIKRKITDKDLIEVIEKVLNNFETEKGKGLPLGNYTSQFFANVYLNELDYYVKHILKVKYYIRYVDDFVILHKNKKRLEYFKNCIENFLPCLKIKLHPDKTKIYALRNGINFLGYRVFYYYILLRKRNIKYFKKKFKELIKLNEEELNNRLAGYNGYFIFASSYNLQKDILSLKNSYEII